MARNTCIQYTRLHKHGPSLSQCAVNFYARRCAGVLYISHIGRAGMSSRIGVCAGISTGPYYISIRKRCKRRTRQWQKHDHDISALRKSAQISVRFSTATRCSTYLRQQQQLQKKLECAGQASWSWRLLSHCHRHLDVCFFTIQICTSWSHHLSQLAHLCLTPWHSSQTASGLAKTRRLNFVYVLR